MQTRNSFRTVRLKEKPEAESTFNENFAKAELIGKGGNGSVYKVLDSDSGRYMALKVLNPEIAHNKTKYKQLQILSEKISQFCHPNLVDYYEHGKLDNGAPYLLMEYVDGESLASILKRKDRLEPDMVLNLAKQICDALDYAHQNGIIHLDIKPSNIIVTSDNRIKVIDFGISRLVDGDLSIPDTVTQAKEVAGSPYYMSPELCQDKKISASTDIYSLGCVLYEMLNGCPPFSGSTVINVLLKHINEEVSLFSTESDIDVKTEKFGALLLKCLEKHPKRRYQSARELLDDLVRIENGKKTKAEVRNFQFDKIFASHKTFIIAVSLLIAGCLAFFNTIDLGITIRSTTCNIVILWILSSICSFLFFGQVLIKWRAIKSGKQKERDYWQFLTLGSVASLALSFFSYSLVGILISFDPANYKFISFFWSNNPAFIALSLLSTLSSGFGWMVFRNASTFDISKLALKFTMILSMVSIMSCCFLPSAASMWLVTIGQSDLSFGNQKLVFQLASKIDPHSRIPASCLATLEENEKARNLH